MADDTLIATGARNVLRMERRYPHPPAKVWRAITDAEQLSGWFPFAVEPFELREGAAMRFAIGGEDRGAEANSNAEAGGAAGADAAADASAGVVVEVDPPRLFAFEWGGDLLRFEPEPEGDAACRLVFTHTFDDHYGAASFAAGWDACLRALTTLLDDNPSAPALPDMNAAHERYVAQFGLGAAVVESGPDGCSVRIERQLTQPAERVWELIGGDGPGIASARPPTGAAIASLTAGTILTSDPPRLHEYEWLAGDRVGGRVRWELGEGTGHGARLVLTQTGAPGLDAERDAARVSTEARVAQLAATLAAEPRVPAG